MNKPKQNDIRNHEQEKDIFFRRIIVSLFIILLLTSLLLANFYKLEVIDFKEYTTRADDNRIRVIAVAPQRGRILDRNGVVLADNKAVYSLEVIPEKVADMQSALTKLKILLDLTDLQITRFQEAVNQTRQFKSIALVPELSEKQVAVFSVNGYQFPGISIEAHNERFYPFAENLTHVLGYVAKINDRDIKNLKAQEKYSNYKNTRVIGKLGIEQYYEDILHGKSGYKKVETNNLGRIMRTIENVPPVSGKDIKLNIDINLQLYAAELLTETTTDPLSGKVKIKHKRGSVVVLDPRDNSVLAMFSSPSYDPNLFVQGISYAQYNKLLNDPDRPLFNRATLGAYPPASTVKPLVAAAALSEGVITPETTRNFPGWWRIPNSKSRKFRDDRHGGFGDVNIYQAIERSVNTFFYQIAFDLGIDRLSAWMSKFGYGQLSGIDINEDTPANMPTRKWKEAHYHTQWYQGDTIPVGIGQGYWTATPLQIAKAISVVANKGLVHRPHLVKSIIEHGVETPLLFKNFAAVSSVKQSDWAVVEEGMRRVISTGTGRFAFKDSPYQAAGKSGTSQVFGLPDTHKYDASKIAELSRDHALFTAFAPLDKPQVLVSAVLENAGWGRNAAPIVKKLMDAELGYGYN
ncbi:penicillin-binding protein 2 [Psychromonas aquimarina]|uniref:penicillin-binding protein 2 n=1 Tax=Psychromonas aquimarina TaxID=444919 RepID=UPI00041D6B7E|nr:penicillin-binding protein 2 [Psychromonas aquimarina]